jgi:hypothetical protein
MARETAESSFDELTRGLASGSISRGRALRLMGAALVGGTLASLGVGGVAVADNECKPTGKKCRKDKQCCSGKCEGGTCASPPPPDCTPGTSCGPGGVGFCLANASGAGTICSCGDTSCAASCDQCSASQVCVQAAGVCGEFSPFVCVTPCPTCLPNCASFFVPCTSNEQCCSNICEDFLCKPSVGFNCG